MVVKQWDLLSVRYLDSKLTLSSKQKRRFLLSLSCSAYKEQNTINSKCLKGPSRIVEPRASDLSTNAAQRFAGNSQEDRTVPHADDVKALPHMWRWRATNPSDRIFQAPIHSHTNTPNIKHNGSKLHVHKSVHRTDVFLNLTEVFLTLTDAFLTLTEVFLNLTEVFLTLRFFLPWQVFLNLTEVFLNQNEVFLNLTEVFLTQTEVFLALTEVFLNLTEVFLNLTEIFLTWLRFFLPWLRFSVLFPQL